ncbi:hypothetical protein A3F01_03475 [Candidatus Woesebacteria bacterium RIFCSPHIGHO2_12_FULL_38_11]|nr:MAG: hypothetical protein A3F01_03475 [Candidatus Woesebacteria bacterium RIFCSPHIGHO2_12_FULL_38_11]
MTYQVQFLRGLRAHGFLEIAMSKTITKLIEYLFFLLLLLTPLVVFPKTSELFEFNKMILTYIFTVLIISLWIIRIIIEGKVIFRRSLLDIPLIVFLISQFLSTIVSVDYRTSLLGYYSRFHGGFMSSVSYSFVYWAYVSNMNRESTHKALKFLFSSALIVSMWGILEQTGHSLSCLLFPEFKSFDVSCWVQDVKNRVFATIGQPNWLAAWIVVIIPLAWAYGISNKLKKSNYKVLNKLFWIMLSTLFLLTLLYTKSRSGLGAFVLAFFLFWISTFLLFSFNKIHTTVLKKLIVFSFLITLLMTGFIIFAVGTPWTPRLRDLISNQQSTTDSQQPAAPVGPALEVGGTESGKIRGIVWKGAIDIWKHYPILGTGVETFAFSYYNFRPVEHNLVSEWDYLYNKAHNEYLNFAATTGTLGLLSYLFLIGAVLYQITKISITSSQKDPNSYILLPISLLAGFSSILVTNFFGFSVVIVALLFLLYPAMAVTLGHESKSVEEYKFKTLSNGQILGILISCTLALILLYSISKYWYADYLYAQGKLNNDAGNFVKGRELINRAVSLSPKESIFWSELSSSTATLALFAAKQNDSELAKQLANSAVIESGNAVALSPANVNLKRDMAARLVDLAPLNPNYIISARDTLIEASRLAPTEAKLQYNLSIAHLRVGDYAKAIEVMEKVIDMKPDYRQARYALALMYIDADEKQKAKDQLEYILNNLNRDDVEARRELTELGL